jgi:hypothetical protein
MMFGLCLMKIGILRRSTLWHQRQGLFVRFQVTENFIDVYFETPLILKEGQIFTFTIKSSTDVFFKDLIYITDETSKKDVFTLPDIYTEYNAGKTEYIVL